MGNYGPLDNNSNKNDYPGSMDGNNDASGHADDANLPPGTSSEPRSRLTDAEKKQNHILSEQKRRQAIRSGFDRLASIVPGMAGQGRSEAVVLDATVKEIKKELARKEYLRAHAIGMGYLTPDEFYAAFEGEGGSINNVWDPRYTKNSSGNAGPVAGKVKSEKGGKTGGK